MNILVLPGTVWQLPLIKKVKAMGHAVHLVNPVRNEGITELADFFMQSDIFDEKKIIAYCKENKIDAVMSDECDIATDAIARYNKAIGSNSIGEDIAELFTNKFKMREFCGKHNLNPLPHALCKNMDEAKKFLRENGPKVIMKPLDSNSSHGVFTVLSEKDIEDKFEETCRFSRNSKAVLLEEYIEGTEFTVDGIMTKSGHKTLAISEKDHYKHNDNIANTLFFTQTNKKFDYNRLREINDTIINTTGLPYGITHVEYKYDETSKEFFLIEMAARGGGNLISAIIAPFMSGVDNYEYLINASLDRYYDKDITVDLDNDRTAILKFFDIPCQGGIVREIIGEDYLKNEPNIKSYKLNFQVGDYIRKPESDSVRIGYYIICAETRREFDTVLNNIEKKFSIVLADKEK